jgi:hypothetical protein
MASLDDLITSIQGLDIRQQNAWVGQLVLEERFGAGFTPSSDQEVEAEGNARLLEEKSKLPQLNVLRKILSDRGLHGATVAAGIAQILQQLPDLGIVHPNQEGTSLVVCVIALVQVLLAGGILANGMIKLGD